MLVKEELRKLRSLKATPKMIQIASNDIDNKKYKVLLRVQNLKGFIKIAVFNPKKIRKGILTPRLELFINPQTGENISRKIDDNNAETGWSNGYITNLTNYWRWSSCSYISNDGNNTLKQLGNEKDVMWRIFYYQQEKRKEKNDKREKLKLEEWDKEMGLVPEPPKGVDEWLHKKVIEDNYVFYNKKTGVCYCSYCRKEMPLEKELPVMKTIYKHNNKAKCYSCGKTVKMKNINQLAKLTVTKGYSYQVISKISNAIVIRVFWIQLYYNKKDYKKPYRQVEEYIRIIFDGKSIKQYYYDYYKNSYKRWIAKNSKDYYCYPYAPYLYKKNLRSIESVIGKKSAIVQYIRAGNKNIKTYIEKELEKPYLEKIIKAGLNELGRDVIDRSKYLPNPKYDECATELAKILLIDKNRLARLRKMKMQNYAALMWLQEEKKNDTTYDNELIEEFALDDIIPFSFEFLEAKMSYRKIYNYLIVQTDPDETLKSTISTWKDYMNMAKKLGMRTECEQIYKPKNLKDEHDKCVEMMQKGELEIETKALENKWPTATAIIKTLTKYEYKGEKYSIVAPKSIYDIVVEGTILKHCVHTCDFYFDAICRKESYILFLRRNDRINTPYYTLEVEPSGNIRQKRTTGDNQNKDFQNATDFLKKWQQVIKQRLDDEDKKLGEKSNELRKKKYKELREKGSKIWHGRLAGKLLADVLENDFMSAM